MKPICKKCGNEIERNQLKVGATWIHSNGHKPSHAPELVSTADIQKLCVKHFGKFTLKQLLSRDKSGVVAIARHLICIVAREAGNTTQEIAEASGRTISNVNSSLKTAQDLIDTNKHVTATYQIMTRLAGYQTVSKYKIGGAQPARERIYVTGTNISKDGVWIRLSAANAKHGTPPEFQFVSGDVVILEETPQI